MTTLASDKADPLRAAFRRRAQNAVEHMVRSASLESLVRALEAPTDFGAIASAMGGTAMPPAALELDPLADAMARGAAARARLAEKAGGLLSAAAFGKALGGISRQAVDKRRRADQALAVRVANDWRYPAMQLREDGRIYPGLPDILRAGAACGLTGWAMLDFLLAPDSALGGSAPADILRRGTDMHEVLRILRAASVDAFG
jgi:hypothetical protein